MAQEATPKDTHIAQDELPQDQEQSSKTVDRESTAIGDVKIEEKDKESIKFDEPKPGLAILVDDVKENGDGSGDVSADSVVVERAYSFKEESNLPSDLKDFEKKALFELRSKLEDAIITNKLFRNEQVEEAEKTRSLENEGEEREKSMVNEDETEEKSRKLEVDEGKEAEKTEKEGQKEEEKYGKDEIKLKEEKEAIKEGEREITLTTVDISEKEIMEVDMDIKLWGVPLLPSKGDKGTDVVLLKFLRAREFRVQESFEMLRNTLKWRKENVIDSILEEEFPPNLSSVAYMQGMDRHGHPICYNIFGTFWNDEIYSKIFGSEEMRHKFLRWRFQLMERGIQKLDLGAGGATSILQVNDLKNSPGPTKKELRQSMKQAVGLLQDNYPEFVTRNIFVNVPFWSYAFYAVVSPFFTQRSKSKFDFARPAKVTETLLKYIDAQQIPVHYGGLNRENDSDFSIEDGVAELIVKSGSSEPIEIPAPEVGTTFIWDLTVIGWEVNYKEEFVPTDPGSYTMIVQKGRRIGWQEGSARNSFKNKEPGKLVLTVENASYKKKKVLYRYKVKTTDESSSSAGERGLQHEL